MRMRIGLGVGALAAGVTIAVPVAAGAASGAAHHRTPAVRVSAVSNPPATAPARLTLHIRGSASRVTVYASPVRRRATGAVTLARARKIRHGQLTVAVPASLRSGAWFIVVCPAAGRGACAVSTRPMRKTAAVVLPPAAGPAGAAPTPPPTATTTTTPSTTTTTPPDTPPTLSPPVQATPVPETAQAATGTIGSAGGTLTATAADGTVLSLQIPAGSVPDGTQITMTPLASVGGADWAGQLIGAVQFAPEGLVLYHGATLTVTPTHPVPAADQVAFGYTGEGNDLTEVPLAPTTSAIEIPIAHFSGAGVGDAPGGATPPSSGSTDVDFYEQLIAEVMAQARSGQISEAAAFEEAEAWLPDMYNDIMADEVPPGLSDDTAAEQASKDLIRWARDTALLTGNDPLAVITPTLLRLLQGMYNRAQQRCATNHDLTAIPQILNDDRSEQLLGATGPGLGVDLQCMHFRLDFDSLIHVYAGSSGSGQWNLEYTAHPTLTMDPGEGYTLLDGDTTGSYTTTSGSITVTANGSTTTTTALSGTGATFSVVNLALPGLPGAGQATSPALILDVGQPTEKYRAVDSGGDSTTISGFNWLEMFTALHPPSAADSGWTGLTLTPAAPGGSLVASGTFNDTAPGGGGDDTTTVQVIHTPPPWTG